MSKVTRQEQKQEMSERRIEATAIKAGYKSAEDQAYKLCAQQYPGYCYGENQHDEFVKLANKIVDKAIRTNDDIARIIAMQNW
ncbi:MAG: hypothetical protein PHP57_06460 [Sideroxydans sp.]|nr:hypothetical protein [Sideroxydans sp.]